MARTGRGLMVLLAVLMLAGTLVATAKVTVDKSRVYVDKCRKHCIAELTPDAGGSGCLRTEQCLRCWAACQAFQSDHFIRDYCKRSKACTAGCQQACLFYLGHRDQLPTGLGQTSHETEAEPGQPVTEPLTTSDQTVSGSKSREGDTVWRPRLAGLTSTASLVSASVTWPARAAAGQYLVTWELLSGGLRGHLVSEETAASLPLWPDQQYLVQVFCDGGASQPLRIDTNQSKTIQPENYKTPAELSIDDEASIGDGRALPTEKPVEIPSKSTAKAYSEVGIPAFARVAPLIDRSHKTPAQLVPSAASIEATRTDGDSAGRQVIVPDRTPTPLASASLLLASMAQSSETSSSDTSSDDSARSEEPGAVVVRLPALLAALAVLVLVLGAGVVLAVRARLRSQQRDQRDQRWTSADRDRRTLLDQQSGEWRSRPLPRVSVNPRRTPIFVVPCHKR
ncbi:uncharacterized protein LOC122363257 [Amphibalanus amphitrite]|uniref:uncharacterized protein LOC122363257 n=1 Tax=Amphibalanus amphitrite TaxID=1232801 RepID=UPI001C905E34|nr:uncharacterized protein LOC122363257 [Amphibalanus amphitrite]